MKATKAQIAAWKKIYDALGDAGDDSDEENGHIHWVNEESHVQSICVGWCMGQGMTLDDALDFYDQMIPLELF